MEHNTLNLGVAAWQVWSVYNTNNNILIISQLIELLGFLLKKFCGNHKAQSQSSDYVSLSLSPIWTGQAHIPVKDQYLMQDNFQLLQKLLNY